MIGQDLNNREKCRTKALTTSWVSFKHNYSSVEVVRVFFPFFLCMVGSSVDALLQFRSMCCESKNSAVLANLAFHFYYLKKSSSFARMRFLMHPIDLGHAVLIFMPICQIDTGPERRHLLIATERATSY